MDANLKSGFWLAREAENYLEKTRYSHYFCNFIIIARMFSHSSKHISSFLEDVFPYKIEYLKNYNIGFLVYFTFKSYFHLSKIETDQMVKKKNSVKVFKIFSDIFRAMSSIYNDNFLLNFITAKR